MDIRAEVAAAVKSFRIEEAELERLLQEPVNQDLARRAIRVQNSAKQHATQRPGPRVRTGRLRDSITWRLGQDGLSRYADVGSSVSYAPHVELGHNVVRDGRVVGHARPFPFLRPALDAARL